MQPNRVILSMGLVVTKALYFRTEVRYTMEAFLNANETTNISRRQQVHKQMLNAIHICAMICYIRCPKVLQFTMMWDKLHYICLTTEAKNMTYRYTKLMALKCFNTYLKYMTSLRLNRVYIKYLYKINGQILFWTTVQHCNEYDHVNYKTFISRHLIHNGWHFSNTLSPPSDFFV